MLEAVEPSVKLKAAVFDIVGVLALTIAQVVMSGWVLTILWGWFIVPLFSVPYLTIAQALGISMTVGYVTKNIDWNQPRSGIWLSAGRTALQIAFVLVVGWLVHQFV